MAPATITGLGSPVAAFPVRHFEQGRRIGARPEPARVDGQPGALAYNAEDRLTRVLSLDVVNGRVQAMRTVVAVTS